MFENDRIRIEPLQTISMITPTELQLKLGVFLESGDAFHSHRSRIQCFLCGPNLSGTFAYCPSDRLVL
jgi:hypothetical protein